VGLLIPFGKLEACRDKRKPEAYATASDPAQRACPVRLCSVEELLDHGKRDVILLRVLTSDDAEQRSPLDEHAAFLDQSLLKQQESVGPVYRLIVPEINCALHRHT